MKYLQSTVLIAAAIFILSCNNKKYSFDQKAKNNTTLEMKEPADKPLNETFSDNIFKTDTSGAGLGQQQIPEQRNKKQPTQTATSVKPDWDKKIIKNASLNLEVKDYNAYYSLLREKVRSVGGYVAQEEQSLSEYKTENILSIKVPVDQFDNAVALLTNNIEKLNEKKISSQDVTTEFVDIKSRMEAKRQVRQRYMDLLKLAKNMEEILSVQSEINGIQEEIESAAGRIEYLGHSSAFSTINLTFFQVLNSSARSTGDPSFSAKLISAFKTGTGWVSDLFVGLVSIWPLFLLIFIVLIVRRKSRIRKPQQA